MDGQSTLDEEVKHYSTFRVHFYLKQKVYLCFKSDNCLKRNRAFDNLKRPEGRVRRVGRKHQVGREKGEESYRPDGLKKLREIRMLG